MATTLALNPLCPLCGVVTSSLNPFTWAADALKSVLNQFGTLLELLLLKPMLPNHGSALDVLYGNSIGLMALAPLLAIIALTVAVFYRKAVMTAIQSLIALVLVTTLVGFSFIAWDWLLQTRLDFVSQLMTAQVFGASHRVVSIPDFTGLSAILVLIGAALILFYTIQLIVMLYVEAIGIILAKVGTPLAFLVYPYGVKGRQALSVCLAAGVVSTFAGPLVACFVLQVGRLLSNSFTGSSVAEILFFVASLRIAAKSQLSMYKSLKAYAFTKISGAVVGRSQVSGNVNSTIKRDVDVKVRNQAAAAHAASLPGINTDNRSAGSKFKHGAEFVLREAAIFASGAAVAELATKAGTAARIGLQVAEGVHQTQKSRRGRRR